MFFRSTYLSTTVLRVLTDGQLISKCSSFEERPTKFLVRLVTTGLVVNNKTFVSVGGPLADIISYHSEGNVVRVSKQNHVLSFFSICGVEGEMKATKLVMPLS